MDLNIDETIRRVEVLFETITGTAPPTHNGAYSPIPPELDAGTYVEKQLERLLELIAAPSALPTWVPPMSIYERGGDLVIELDVAGLGQPDIECSMVNRILTIRGRRPGPMTTDRVLVSEWGIGPFVRSVQLPPNVDTKKLSLQVKDGRAEIRFPQQVDEKPARPRARVSS